MPDWKPRKGMTYIAARRNDDLGPVKTVEVESDPDKLGRCRYTMLWMQDCDADISAGIPAGIRQKAQCFFAVPPLPDEVGNVPA